MRLSAVILSPWRVAGWDKPLVRPGGSLNI